MHENIVRRLADGAWRGLPFEPFREGVEVHWMRAGGGEPEIALLKYAPGASIPPHLHSGVELIYVLDGIQSDEAGDYPAGTAVINPPGSRHSVWSENGCVVLIHWSSPVQLLDEE